MKALVSSEGEVVTLENPVEITEKVELWLGDLSNEMKMTLKSILVRCVRENLDSIDRFFRNTQVKSFLCPS